MEESLQIGSSGSSTSPSTASTASTAYTGLAYTNRPFLVLTVHVPLVNLGKTPQSVKGVSAIHDVLVFFVVAF